MAIWQSNWFCLRRVCDTFTQGLCSIFINTASIESRSCLSCCVKNLKIAYETENTVKKFTARALI